LLRSDKDANKIVKTTMKNSLCFHKFYNVICCNLVIKRTRS